MFKSTTYTAFIFAIMTMMACSKASEVTPDPTTPTTVTPKATFDFPSGTLSAPCDVTFANTATGGNTTTYQWTFGDGGFSTLKNPTHRYTASGTYTVELVATNSMGTSTISKLIRIARIYSNCAVFNVSLTRFPTDYLYLSNLNYLAIDYTGATIANSTTTSPSTTYTQSNLPLILNQNNSSMLYTNAINDEVIVKIGCYNSQGEQIFKEIAFKPTNYLPVMPGATISGASITTPDGWGADISLKWN